MTIRLARLPRAAAAGLAVSATLIIAAAIATSAEAGADVPDAAPDPAATLSGMTVSPNFLIAGSTSSGTVSRRTGNMTRVELKSSNTAVATVPTHIWLPRGATSGAFDVTTAGGRGGCATVSATDPDNTVSAKIYTYQRPARVPGPVNLKLAHDMPWGKLEYDTFIYGPSTFKGLISGSGVAGRTFTLSSSTAAVSVPRQVTAGVGATSVEFTARITGRADCAVITATEGRTTVSRLLAFVDVGG